jgi:hypothetical protein
VLCSTGDVAVATPLVRPITATAGVLFATVALVLSIWVGAFGAAAATPSGSSTSSRSTTPLVAPKTSIAQDRKYLTDVTLADPGLVGYEQKQGNVALRALLTDGSAFCALLKREGAIDDALIAEASGARSTEAQTHLPLKIATFNTIEAVALLTLCPSEQKLVPASVRAKIHNLAKALAKQPG